MAAFARRGSPQRGEDARSPTPGCALHAYAARPGRKGKPLNRE
jgi:hypothetical protein